MNTVFRHRGFSLTEVLLAVGTLAIGMSFIAGTFIVGVYLSTIATERTVAAVVADEAFAKIQLYGTNNLMPNPPTNQQEPYAGISSIPVGEFAYPSTKILADKQYYWAALCRPVNSILAEHLMQVTVFISRNVGSSTVIPEPVEIPVTVVTGTGNENKLMIDNAAQQSFINAGSKIVANQTGKLYRVVDRDAVTGNTIILDIPWQETGTDSVWVIPPIGTGKNPCIAVYQREIRF